MTPCSSDRLTEVAKTNNSSRDRDLPTGWSADGRILLFREYNGLDTRLGHANLGGPTDGSRFKPGLVEGGGVLSPDRRFVAYWSNVSGKFEVYVSQFPDGSCRKQISQAGGSSPYWRSNGRELFYVGENSVIAVPITLGNDMSFGVPKKLFPYPADSSGLTVSADGQRFIFVEPIENAKLPVLRVVQNWSAEFRDRHSVWK